MSEIRSQCEGCGQCCKAIFLPITHSEMVTDLEVMKRNRNTVPEAYTQPISEIMDDKSFIIAHWYPITKAEALERNPHIQSWADNYEKAGKTFEEQLNNNFYGCSFLNEETGRCRTHENLPRVCSEYPWYGGKPSLKHEFYTADCFYKNDLVDLEA